VNYFNVSIESLFSAIGVSWLSKKKEWYDIVGFNVCLPMSCHGPLEGAHRGLHTCIHRVSVRAWCEHLRCTV
jgi:hypothetical protein